MWIEEFDLRLKLGVIEARGVLDGLGELPAELFEICDKPGDDELLLGFGGVRRCVRSDIRISVPVAPDPGVVAEDVGNFNPIASYLKESIFQISVELGHDIQDRAIKEVERVSDFFVYRQAFVAHLVGVPQLKDDVLESLGQVVANVERAVEVVGSLTVGEEVGDISKFVEDHFSLRFGRVRGEGRGDPELVDGFYQPR